MKAFGKFLTLVLLISFLAACGAPAAPAPEATKAPEAEVTAAEQWAKDNGVGPYTPKTEDWAAIEEAAKKEGSVVVYANSSKIEKLIEPWNELYPDIALEGGDTDDIAVKMSAEQEAGNVVGDVWFNSDGHLLFGEFVPNQWMWWYVPPGVEIEGVTPEQPFALARRAVDVIGYNSEIFPEGCPATNWWQFTEPQLKGKFYLEDPLSDSSTTAKLTLFVKNADEMAAAYKSLYGKEWNTDEAYGDDIENAGYLFLKKLAQNEPGIQPGGDEVDSAYATLGMDTAVEPGYGWTGLSSYEATMDGELAMGPCYDLEPVAGILKSSYLGIANKAPHPNAAKLFIKFALSEEGAKPWTAIGIYPGVDSLPLAEGMPAIGTYKLWESNDAFAWANNSAVRDFFATELLGGE
jgi:iron(III) transport system substrate-binding protein